MHITQGAHCASCYGQYEKRKLVDFDAAYDGPVLDDDAHRVTIDDLVVCEECLGSAARLLGWTPSTAADQENASLVAENDQLRQHLTLTQRAVDSLAGSVGDLEKAKWGLEGGPATPRPADEKARRAQERAKAVAARKVPPARTG